MSRNGFQESKTKQNVKQPFVDKKATPLLPLLRSVYSNHQKVKQKIKDYYSGTKRNLVGTVPLLRWLNREMNKNAKKPKKLP